MTEAKPVAPNSVTGIQGRQPVRAFDLAAGLAVFFMILVHVLWHWGAPDTWSTPIGMLISFAAGPTAAPVFAFLMGASLGAAPRTSFATMATRGLWLVFLGYVLNLLRGTIPASIGLSTGIVTQQQIDPFTPWWLLTTVDLHHMVGLSLIAIAALRAWVRPGWVWVAVAFVVALVAPWLRTVAFGTPVLDAPLTPFLGSAQNVYYAVIPWVVYPLVGAVFGAAIVRSTDQRRMFRRAAVLGLALVAVGVAMIAVQQPSFDVYTYWRMPWSFIVAIFGIIFLWTALCDVVTRLPAVDRRLGIVYGWSDRVIAMYFSHWIIVGWGVGLVGFRQLELVPVLIAMAVAVVITSYASRLAVRLEASPWFRRAPAEFPAT